MVQNRMFYTLYRAQGELFHIRVTFESHHSGQSHVLRVYENIANNCIPDVALSLDGKIMGADVFQVFDYVGVHFQLRRFPSRPCELEIKVDCLSGDDESTVGVNLKTIFTTVWVETVSIKPTFTITLSLAIS